MTATWNHVSQMAAPRRAVDEWFPAARLGVAVMEQAVGQVEIVRLPPATC